MLHDGWLIIRKRKLLTKILGLTFRVYLGVHRGFKPNKEVSPSSATNNNKFSCHTKAARCFVSLNISLSHSVSLKMTPLSTARVRTY